MQLFINKFGLTFENTKAKMKLLYFALILILSAGFTSAQNYDSRLLKKFNHEELIFMEQNNPYIISLSSIDGNNLWFVTADGIAEFEFVIVNRWGNTIYTFNDVNGSWDGTTEAGKLVAEGTYFYRIRATDEGG